MPTPTTKSPPVVDDRVRTDGGNPTDDQRIPEEELAKAKKNAIDHTKDEPGS